MQTCPQFGQPHPVQESRDRPAAFGIAPRDGRIALVRVTYPDAPPFLDLPGGALDPGETAQEALIREFGEETGLKVLAEREIARADQYFLTKGDEPVNNRCIFFEARLAGEGPELKIEEDHELVWLEPDEAVRRLRHDAHAWGVAAWLRRRSR